MVFGNLIIAYLFLGGAGAGTLVVLSFLELLNAQHEKVYQEVSAVGLRALPNDFFAKSWPLCLCILVFAMMCLLFDIGRFDRVLVLFASATASPLVVGAFSLLTAAAVSSFFCIIRLFDVSEASYVLTKAVSILGILTGFLAATYTGVLLFMMPSVVFWGTLFLPVLFLLSSLSSGIACIFLGSVFVEARESIVGSMRSLARIDMLLIMLELLCLAAYAVVMSGREAAHGSLTALLTGDLSWLFWGGLVLCGLLAPMFMERYISDDNYRVQALWIALFLLVGSLILRYCIVSAGAYDITQQPELAANWLSAPALSQ